MDNTYKGWFHEKKVAVLLDFVQIRGGEGPAQIFCHLFISAFFTITMIREPLFNMCCFQLGYLGNAHCPDGNNTFQKGASQRKSSSLCALHASPMQGLLTTVGLGKDFQKKKNGFQCSNCCNSRTKRHI